MPKIQHQLDDFEYSKADSAEFRKRVQAKRKQASAAKSAAPALKALKVARKAATHHHSTGR